MSSLPAFSENDQSTHPSIELGDATRGMIYATFLGSLLWSLMIGLWSLI